MRMGRFQPISVASAMAEGWKSRANTLKPSISEMPLASRTAPFTTSPVPVLVMMEVPRLSPMMVPSLILPKRSTTITSPFTRV